MDRESFLANHMVGQYDRNCTGIQNIARMSLVAGGISWKEFKGLSESGTISRMVEYAKIIDEEIILMEKINRRQNESHSTASFRPIKDKIPNTEPLQGESGRIGKCPK